MRFINGFMCAVLITLVLMQMNDPDFFFWVPVYAIPAVWAGLAARHPAGLARPAAALLLGVTLALAAVGAWWFWPQADRFWQQEMWWRSEVTREGVGMMIVTLSLVLVAFATLGARPDDDTSAAQRPTPSDLGD